MALKYMDILSRLGVSSAHPGGFKSTVKLLEKALQPGALKLLEVGCGTGRSARHLARQGFHVTALDPHPLMLSKAKQRAEQEGLEGIQWVEGSAEHLPFESGSFDVVFAESVTLFTDVRTAVQEYYRVLKPGGRLLDRELVLHSVMPEPLYTEIRDYFQIARILTLDEWLESLHQAGFECERPMPEPFWSHEQSVEPDQIRELDLTTLFDPEIGEGIFKYSELMLAQENYFRACDFMAYKR